jgi:hypothetical protein
MTILLSDVRVFPGPPGEWLFATVLCLALSFGVSQALLRQAQIPVTPNQDLARHVASALNFRAALSQGQYVPRLQPFPPELPDSPTFQYYGFLSGAAAQPFLFMGLHGLRAVVFGMIALRFAGFLVLYTTARLLGAGPPAAAVSIVAYGLTPYYISAFYGRVAVPEATAAAILPFTLLGWVQVGRGRLEAGFAILSLSVLLLSLAHPIFLLYGVLLLVGLAFFSPTWPERLTMVGGLVAGLLAAAFQWLPAFVSRGELASYIVQSPFLTRWLSSRSGLTGLPRPAGQTDDLPLYFFTLGWWTVPLLVGLLALVVRHRRRTPALPLLAALAVFLFLAYSPLDVWPLLPKAMYYVQFPYRLLAFCGLLAAVAIAVVMHSLGPLTAAFFIGAMVVTQFAVLRGPEFAGVLTMSDEQIMNAFASQDYTMGNPQAAVSVIATDGWLDPDNRVRLPSGAPTPLRLRLVGTTIFPDPVDIWLAEAVTKRSVSEARSLGPGAFDVVLTIPPSMESSTSLTIVASRYLVPRDLDARSSDPRRLSLRLKRAEFVNGKARRFVGVGDVERTILGPYRRRFFVRQSQSTVPGEVYGIELPMMFSPFVSVTQAGRRLDTEPSIARRIFVNSDAPSLPIDAEYRLPTATLAASLLGVGMTALSALLGYRRRRSSWRSLAP